MHTPPYYKWQVMVMVACSLLALVGLTSGERMRDMSDTIRWTRALSGEATATSLAVSPAGDLVAMLVRYTGAPSIIEEHGGESLLTLPSSSGQSGALILFSAGGDLLWASTVQTPRADHDVSLTDVVFTEGTEASEQLLVLKGVTSVSALHFTDPTGYESQLSLVSGDLGVFMCALRADTGQFGWITRLPCPCGTEVTDCTAEGDEDAQIAVEGDLLAVSSSLYDNVENVLQAYVLIYQLPPFPFVTPPLGIDEPNTLHILPLNVVLEYRLTSVDGTFRLKGLALNLDFDVLYVTGVINGSGSVQLYHSDGSPSEIISSTVSAGQQSEFVVQFSTVHDDGASVTVAGSSRLGQAEEAALFSSSQHLWLSWLSSDASQGGTRKYAAAASGLTSEVYPEPLLYTTTSESDSLNLSSLVIDPSGKPILAATSSAPVYVGSPADDDRELLYVPAIGMAMLISKFDLDGNLEVAFSSLEVSHDLKLLIAGTPGGDLFSAVSSSSPLTWDEVRSSPGVTLAFISDCASCEALSFCDLSAEGSSCSCLPDTDTVSGQCQKVECPNDCSNGFCNEFGVCECDSWFLSPDCTIDSLLSLQHVHTAQHNLGNPYSRRDGWIQINAQCSLPGVDWTYAVGSYSGSVTFGNLATDKISIDLVTAADEVCGFIAMYDNAMSLREVSFVCSLTAGAHSGLDNCAVYSESAAVYAVGTLSNDVANLHFYDEDNLQFSIDVDSQDGSSPQFLVSMGYSGSLVWASAVPACHGCLWRGSDGISAHVTIEEAHLFLSSVAEMPELSSSREGVVSTIYDLSMEEPVVLLQSTCTQSESSGLGTEVIGIEVFQGSFYILTSYSSTTTVMSANPQVLGRFLGLPPGSSHSMALLQFTLMLDVVDTLPTNSHLLRDHETSAVSVGTNHVQSALWIALQRQKEGNTEHCLISIKTGCEYEGGLCFASETDEGFASILNIAVDEAGDTVVLLQLSATAQLTNGISDFDYTGIWALLEPGHDALESGAGVATYAVKISSMQEPMFALLIEPTQSLLGLDDQFLWASWKSIVLDERGRIRLMGSVLQYPSDSQLRLGLTFILDGSACLECSSSGWCYFDSTADGICMCDTTAFGSACQYNILLRFQDISSWGAAANSLGDSTFENVLFSDVVADTTSGYGQVYVCGALSGNVAFVEFLASTPTLQAVTQAEHDRDSFVIAYRPADGAFLWAAFIRCVGDCGVYLRSIEVNPDTGDIFVIGWSDGGSLEFRDPGASASASADQVVSIPSSGATFFAKIGIDSGSWEWIEPVYPGPTSCFYHVCSAPTQQLTDAQTSADISVVSHSNGRVLVAVTGTYQSDSLSYDGFVAQYELAFASSHPSLLYFALASANGDGYRTGRTVTHIGDDVYAAGVWTTPSLTLTALTTSHQFLEDMAAPGLVNRWEAKISGDSGRLLWFKTNQLNEVSFVRTADIFDCAADSAGRNLWLTVSEPRFRAVDGQPTSLIDAHIGSFTIDPTSGTDMFYDVAVQPLSYGSLTSVDGLKFTSLAVDAKDFLVSAGQQSISAWFSPDGFVPQVKLEVPGDSQIAVLASWDPFGNPRFLLRTTHGHSKMTSVYYAPDGSLYATGSSSGGTFFDSFFVPDPTAFLVKFSPCADNCNGNGVCIFGMFGRGAECICHDGWNGDSCSIPHCHDLPICQGRGTCVGPDVCDCDIGFAAPTCLECASGYAPPNCDICSGDLIWPDCQECASPNKLPPLCQNCRDGWMPPSCDVCAPGFEQEECKECRTGYQQPMCLECQPGYHKVGNDCISDCPNPQFAPFDCSSCIPGFALPDCHCPNGFSGSRCDDFTCSELSDCYDRGVCTGPNECFCTDGWGGEACQVPADTTVLSVSLAAPFAKRSLVSRSDIVILDASPSFNVQSPTAELSFSWDCIDVDAPSLPCPVQGSVAAVQQIGSNSLIFGKTYIWKVIVESLGVVGSETVTLEVTIQDPIGITLTLTPSEPLYSASSVTITAHTESGMLDFYWLSTGGEDLSAATVVSAPFTSQVTFPAHTLSGSTSLLVQVTSLTNSVGSESISFDVVPVDEGYCTASPSAGFSLTTNFSLECDSWVSHDGSSLMFQWSYATAEGMQVYLSEPSAAATLQTALPSGSPLALMATIVSASEVYRFHVSVSVSSYAAGSWTSQEAWHALSEVVTSISFWPGETSLSPVEALNQLSLLAIQAGQHQEMPSVADVLEAAELARQSPYLLLTDSSAGQLITLYANLADNRDAGLSEQLVILQALAAVTSEFHANDSLGTYLADASVPFAAQSTIFSALNPSVQLLETLVSTELSEAARAVISNLRTSTGSFLLCGESASFSGSAGHLHVQKGSVADMEDNIVTYQSADSAVFTLTSGAANSIHFNGECLMWARGIYSQILYPVSTQSDTCFSSVNELSLFDESIEMEVDFAEPNYLYIDFPLLPRCQAGGVHGDCLYYDRIDAWSGLGCHLDKDSNQGSRCACTHLTEFAVGFDESYVPPESFDKSPTSESPGSPLGSPSTANDSSASPDSSEKESRESRDTTAAGSNLTWLVVMCSILAGLCLVCIVVGVLLVALQARATIAKPPQQRQTQDDSDGFSYEMNELRLDDLDVYSEDHVGVSNLRGADRPIDAVSKAGGVSRLVKRLRMVFGAKEQVHTVADTPAPLGADPSLFAIDDGSDDADTDLVEAEEMTELRKYAFSGKKSRKGAVKGQTVADDEALSEADDDVLLDQDIEEADASGVNEFERSLAASLASSPIDFDLSLASPMRGDTLESGVAIQVEAMPEDLIANATDEGDEGTERLIVRRDEAEEYESD